MGHRSRKLTQVNKSHKDSSKPKPNLKKPVLVKKNKNKLINMSKELRVLKADQHRKHSIKINADSDFSKRGTNGSAPLLCGVFPLFDFKDTDVIFSLLKCSDPDANITKVGDLKHYSKVNCENFIMKSKKFNKTFAFTACRDFRDRFDYLDLAKVVDWCLFILPNDCDELIGDYNEDLISSLIAQGIPSSCFITLKNSKEFTIKKECQYFESITKLALGDERIRSLSNLNDANKLMRHLAENCKPSFVTSKKSTLCNQSINKKRGYFLIQNMFFEEEKQELTLTSCMRGFGMNMDTTKHVHITGVGDFQVKQVQWISPEQSNWVTERSGEETLNSYTVDHLKEIAEDSVSDEECEGDSENNSSDSDEEEEEEEQVSDIASLDSDNDPNDDKVSFATTAHSGFSVAQIQKFRESRENSMFPDEIEIPYTELGSVKLRKYRGLTGFKNANWPLDENLPPCYSKLQMFKKFQHNRNSLNNTINKLDRNSIDNFVKAGCKTEIVLAPVSKDSWKQIEAIVSANPQRHLIGSNLFVFENTTSVLHFNLRRKTDVDDSAVHALAKLGPSEDLDMEAGEEANSHYNNLDEKYTLKPVAEPIQSKETMVFQAGFRRFSSTPIYSESNANSDQPGNKGKAKYCQFMELKTDVVATIYGPVMYGPVPVLQFRIRQIDLGMEELSPPYVAELVANGSLLSVDPSRPIIKRVLLTGQIYKVNKRSVMIRYMFFNTKDIDYFKMVPLHTKSNKSGRIIGTHGTHGYMKCYFNKPVTQDEVAMMPLYKRVFPKYTVPNMYNHLPSIDHIGSGGDDDADIMDVMDTLF